MAIIKGVQIFTQPYVMTEGGPARATYVYGLYLYSTAFSYANFGYCYRIGGDEFCVLLKNGGNEGRCKQEFLQRLQEKRGEIAFLPTVSYGSAPFSGEDIVKVKDRADQDMYQYKKERKNRKRLS